MVALLALVPPLLVAALLLAEAALPGDLIAPLLSSWTASFALSVVVLAAILAAAYRRRESAILASAWLFLFCGMMLLLLAELVELISPRSDAWITDIFETAAFAPLLIYVGYVAAPLRLLVLGRRRSALYALLGLALLLVVAALTLAPWMRPGAGAHGGAGRVLPLVKPELDALLLMPLALMRFALGAARHSHPYLLVGLGLLLMLPADLLGRYHLASGLAIHEQAAALLHIASQLYVLVGAASGAASGWGAAQRAGGARIGGNAKIGSDAPIGGAP